MIKKPYPYTQNRELSWLRFNQRVLEEAADSSVPLLERLKFVAIFTSNLDEFYMVRCGSLYDLSLIDDEQIDKKSGMHPHEQLDAIYAQCKHLYMMRDQIYKNLNNTLYELQFSNLNWKSLTKKQVKYFNHFFEIEILPLLSPQVIDLHRPFPHLANKELYIVASLVENSQTKYAIVPVPNFIERIFKVPDAGNHYVLLEQIIFHNLNRIFGKNTITSKTIIRVTRNADINLNEKDIDEDDDYRGYMKKILKRRSRLSPIRLEVYKYATPDMIEFLCKHLKIKQAQVFTCKTPLEMKHLYKVISMADKEVSAPLLYPDFTPRTSKYLNPKASIIPQVLNHDVILHYPYQDIDLFLNLLKEASENPNVVSIKITIYRLADHSKVLNYLVRAAENGKDVTVLMELRARFDEQNNIVAAERLEEAGCNVIYGFEDYKVHSKICLITYKNRRSISTITQIGTGNYNEKTSHLYTDYSYITSRSDIGRDAIAFFQNMAISNLQGSYERILTSPMQLKQTILDELDEQIARVKQGQSGYAFFKLNSLTDLEIIKKLSEASQAGVQIEMVIRGICCLLPGLEGYTENIKIYSIVGRFLEHSRIYIFGQDKQRKMYISSADFMTRNTERRVEVAVPILDAQIQEDILDFVGAILKDNTKRRQLLSSGLYGHVQESDEENFGVQDYEIKKAEQDQYVPDGKSFSLFKKLRTQLDIRKNAHR